MDSHPPKISVILPVFNAESTLQRAVDSVMLQSFQDFELIIIDNHSIDRSFQLAQRAAQKDSRIRILEEQRQGVVYAFQKGLEKASSTFIARMDADDEMLANRLLLQYDFLQKNPDFDAVAGLAEYVPHHPNTKGFDDYVRWSNSLVTAQEIELNRFVEMPVINPTTMWRKEISDAFGAYRHSDFPEDYEMWLRWMDQGVKIGKLNNKVLRWYDSKHRLTRTEARYSKEAFHRVRVKYLARYLKKCNPFYPEVWVWGAARQTRRNAEMMQSEGIVITNYIDVVANKRINKNLIHYSKIPKAGNCFILVYVKNPDARRKIEFYLESLTYRKGLDYLSVG